MHMARLAGLDRDDTPVVLVAEGYSEAGVERGLGLRVGVGEETDLVLDGVDHAPNLVGCDRAGCVAGGEDTFGRAAFELNIADPSRDDRRVRACGCRILGRGSDLRVCRSSGWVSPQGLGRLR